MSTPQPERDWYTDRPLDQRKQWYSEVASAYDRVRPRYSRALIDRAVAIAQIPANATILEIGCGPGTATIDFAQLGFRMVCLEPGYDAYALACQNCAPYSAVTLLNSTFEEWTLAPAQFDAVLAATAFHWVSPAIGYAKAAAALRPTGCLLLLWNMTLQPPYNIYQALEPIYQTYAPALARYETHDQQAESLQKMAQTVLDSGRFRLLQTEQEPCEVTYSVADYLLLLSTYSPYIALEAAQREALFQGLQAVLTQVCESVTLSYLSAYQCYAVVSELLS